MMSAMKPNKLFVLLLCAAFSFTARAQQYYTFTKTNEPYADLFNPQIVNNKDSIAADYKWNVPGTYYLFGEKLSSVFTIGRGGFIFCGNTEYFMPVSPYMAYLEKRDVSSSISVLKQDNILKIQWKNMGLTGHSDSDYVNFQLWLYAGQPRIEFRYGPSRVTDTVAFSGEMGPAVVLSMFNSGLTDVYEYHHMIGDPEAPADDTIGAEQSLDSVPAEGVVYRFQNIPAGIARVASPEPMNIYPNPATDFVKIDGVAPSSWYSIIDLSGRVVASGNLSGDNLVDITRVPRGMYLIRVSDKDTIRLSRLLKN
jgi:hypothetical protein